MGYRIVADDNVEHRTIKALRERGHDVRWIGDVSSLGLGADDREIAAYSRDTDRLVLTGNDDFFTDLNPSDSASILFPEDGTLSSRDANEIVK